MWAIRYQYPCILLVSEHTASADLPRLPSARRKRGDPMPDERRRQQLYEELGGILTRESTDELMSYLPPVGWADVATKADLGALRAELKGDIAKLDGRLDKVEGRFDMVEGRFDKVDGRFAKLDGRLDKLDGHVALRIAEGRQGPGLGGLHHSDDRSRDDRHDRHGDPGQALTSGRSVTGAAYCSLDDGPPSHPDQDHGLARLRALPDAQEPDRGRDWSSRAHSVRRAGPAPARQGPRARGRLPGRVRTAGPRRSSASPIARRARRSPPGSNGWAIPSTKGSTSSTRCRSSTTGSAASPTS